MVANGGGPPGAESAGGEEAGRKLGKLEMDVPGEAGCGRGRREPAGLCRNFQNDHIGSGLREKSQVQDQGPKPVHIWLLPWLA